MFDIIGLSFVIVQVEFLAEDEMIEIVPNMTMDTLNLICVISHADFPKILSVFSIGVLIALKFDICTP